MLEYSLFELECLRNGYTFEPFIVKTEDLWSLTIFHITGYVHDGFNKHKQEERDALTDGKAPILAIPGSYSDA